MRAPASRAALLAPTRDPNPTVPRLFLSTHLPSEPDERATDRHLRCVFGRFARDPGDFSIRKLKIHPQRDRLAIVCAQAREGRFVGFEQLDRLAQVA